MLSELASWLLHVSVEKGAYKGYGPIVSSCKYPQKDDDMVAKIGSNMGTGCPPKGCLMGHSKI